MKNIVYLKQLIVFWTLKNRWLYQRVFLKYHFVLNCTRTPCAMPYQMLLKCLKLWVMNRSWLIFVSPGLKPDWLRDIKFVFVKNSYMLLCNILSNNFSPIESKGTERQLFKFCLSPFLFAGTTLASFHLVGNVSL